MEESQLDLLLSGTSDRIVSLGVSVFVALLRLLRVVFAVAAGDD